MNFSTIASKKVAGIPVLYLGAAAVVLFAVWAWKMKGSEVTADEVSAEANADGAPAEAEPDYSGLTPTGTVTVVQPETATEESVKQTNDDWLRAAVTFLIEEKKATPGEAQTAITNYLEGNDLSYDQGLLRDAAIGKLGLPPEKISSLGSTGTKADPPFQRQFTNFPGKHTVKGKNDHTPWQLSAYYGNPVWANANLIAAANPTLGPPSAIYPTGVTVNIPTFTPPSYVTVNSATRSFTAMAKKNGVSVGYLKNLNANTSEPFLVGSKIRVR